MPTDRELIDFLENALAEHDQKGCTAEQKLLYLYRFKERFWTELMRTGQKKVFDYIHEKISELETPLYAETKKQT
jgi:hypothetical protein